jgi:hypothetical protein
MSTTEPPDQQSTPPAIRQPGDVEITATGKHLVVRGSRHALAALSSALVYDPVPLLPPTVTTDFGRAGFCQWPRAKKESRENTMVLPVISFPASASDTN